MVDFVVVEWTSFTDTVTLISWLFGRLENSFFRFLMWWNPKEEKSSLSVKSLLDTGIEPRSWRNLKLFIFPNGRLGNRLKKSCMNPSLERTSRGARRRHTRRHWRGEGSSNMFWSHSAGCITLLNVSCLVRARELTLLWLGGRWGVTTTDWPCVAPAQVGSIARHSTGGSSQRVCIHLTLTLTDLSIEQLGRDTT